MCRGIKDVLTKTVYDGAARKGGPKFMDVVEDMNTVNQITQIIYTGLCKLKNCFEIL